MRSQKAVIVLSLFTALAFSSCSGQSKVGSGGGGGGGGTGTAPVGLTLSAVPAPMPVGLSILSFPVNISQISITSQTTGKVTTIAPVNLFVDLNKMLSDSAYLGKLTVGTDLYSKIQLSIASSAVIYCTSVSGVAGCTAASIQKVTGGPAALTFTYSPALNATTKGIGVRFRLSMSKALILNTAGTAVQSIDFTQPLVGFSESLPLAANLAAGQLDYVEDIAGIVSNVGTSSVTIQSVTAGTITANVVPSTSNFSLQNCPTNDISCAKANQVANFDTIANADGTFTLQLFDPLDQTSNDWIEGVIGYAATTSSQFQMVVTNFVPKATGSLLPVSLHLGDQVTVNLASSTTFAIDQKNLIVPGNTFVGSQSASSLNPGQTVAVRVTTFTPAVGTTPPSVNVNALLLRFSHLSGTPGSPGPNFPFSPFPPYFAISSAQTQETPNVTNYELLSSGAGTTLVANQAAAIRALYLGTPNSAIFVVAKVRQ